jgi:hypothetical protein
MYIFEHIFKYIFDLLYIIIEDYFKKAKHFKLFLVQNNDTTCRSRILYFLDKNSSK